MSPALSEKLSSRVTHNPRILVGRRRRLKLAECAKDKKLSQNWGYELLPVLFEELNSHVTHDGENLSCVVHG